jgi:hypothetical protein
MPKLNRKIVKSNIVDVREQLEQIESQITSGEISEGAFEAMMLHAFHHLNFAWNIRKISTKRYMNLTDDDFNFWGDFPTDLELLRIKS